MKKLIKVELMLDLETLAFLKSLTDLSGQSLDAVVSVILAIEILKRRKDEPAKKKRNKASNAKLSNKSRVAKRK